MRSQIVGFWAIIILIGQGLNRVSGLRKATSGADDEGLGQTDDPEGLTLSFTYLSGYLQHRDDGHIATSLSLKEPIRQLNQLYLALDNAERWAHNATRDMMTGRHVSESLFDSTMKRHAYFATIYGVMREQLARAQAALEFACSLSRCKWRILDRYRGESPHRVPPEMDLKDPDSAMRYGKKNQDRPSFYPSLNDEHSEWRHKRETEPVGARVNEERDRMKRQIMLGAAALGAVTVGLSIYTEEQVRHLKANVFRLDRNNRLLKTTINQNQQAISSLSRITENLIKRLETDERFMMKYYREHERNEATFLFEMVSIELLDYAQSIITVLIDKKLDPHLFRAGALTNAIGGLKKQAAEHDLELAYTSLNDVINSDVSFLVEDHQIYVIVHVPVVSKKKYSLMKYVNVPLRMSDGTTLRVFPEATYLAKSASMNYFVELTDSDLRQCKKSQGQHICRGGVAATNGRSSCLAALYTMSPEVKEVCRFARTIEKSEALVQVSPTEVLVVAPSGKATSAFVSCKGESQRTIKVETMKKIPVGNGCTLATPSFVYEAPYLFDIRKIFTTRILSDIPGLNVSELAGVWSDDGPDRDDGLVYLEGKVKELRQHLNATSTNLSNSYESYSSTATIFQSVGTTAAIILVIFLTYLLVRQCRIDRWQRRKRRARKEILSNLEGTTGPDDVDELKKEAVKGLGQQQQQTRHVRRVKLRNPGSDDPSELLVTAEIHDAARHETAL